MCFEKDGFRNSIELYAEESSNRSGWLLEPGRRLSAWGDSPELQSASRSSPDHLTRGPSVGFPTKELPGRCELS